MTIAYSYKINAARVAAEDGLTDVIKEIEVTVTGTDGAAKFELPVVVKLDPADPQNFMAFATLTEAQVISWIENYQSLDGTKAHIAFVVAKEAERIALENKPLPWAPAPEPAPAPAPTEPTAY